MWWSNDNIQFRQCRNIFVAKPGHVGMDCLIELRTFQAKAVLSQLKAKMCDAA